MEDLTLNKIADMIINSVYSGLHKVNNISLSKDQVKDEINILRNRMGLELMTSGLLDTSSMTQTINCLKVKTRDIKDCCDEKPRPNSDDIVYHTTIPNLLRATGFCPVYYIGTADKKVSFKFTVKPDFIHRLRHDRFTKNKPLAWVNGNDLWIFNMPKSLKGTKEIAMIGIFDNPRSLDSFKCCNFGDDDPYPAPSVLIDRIVGKLIEDYLRYYRYTMPLPNTGADFPNVQPPKKVNNA